MAFCEELHLDTYVPNLVCLNQHSISLASGSVYAQRHLVRGIREVDRGQQLQ